MSKETKRQFRRNSQFVANNMKAFQGADMLAKQRQQMQIEQLLARSIDDEEEYEEEEGWANSAENVVYSDTDSSSSSDDSDSDDSDEFADKKKEVQEKLRVTQRRFATLFAENDVTLPATDKSAAELQEEQRRINALMPPSVHEEDFRNRRRGKVRHENYFGDQAKSSFLSRYHWVSQEQSVLDHGTDDLVNHTVFEENAVENSHSIDFPFMPRRPMDPEDVSVATADPFENDNISLLFCEDFDVPEDRVEADRESVGATRETHSVATLDLSATMQFNKQTETTPRTKFIAACIQAKVHPRASLLLRKNVSTELNLQHQGMGDSMATVLAKSLPDLPFVHSINLTDNNLTGVGLQPLIHSMALLPSLTKINISQNTVNRDTAIALASYVAKTPILCNLILHHADVDDYECTMFVAAITDNRALVELDLSHNEIGTAELLNSVQPSLTTGAESLADFLCSNNCYIHTLQLQWNKIRLDGARSLAEALIINNTVTHLDLSYNALGPNAGQVLGHALLTNQTLKWLNIASNNINSIACFTICMGMLDNYCIEYVNLDSNPIGNFGLRMVMQMPLEVGTRIKISAQKCNLSRSDPRDVIYRHDDPAGTYVLQLDDHFERAVCFRLLRLVATNTNYRFKSFGYEKARKVNSNKDSVPSFMATSKKRPPPKKSAAKKKFTKKKEVNKNIKPIRLVLSNSRDKIDNMDEATSKVLETLYKLEQAAGNEEMANQLFDEYDDDGNGSLDVDEVHKLIQNIGISFDRPTLVKAIEVFDIDGAGTLEYEEFMQFLRAQRQEARGRIKELTVNPIMASTKLTSMKYIPPKVGTMHIEVEDSFSSTGTNAVMSTNAHTNMMEMVQGGTESHARILTFSIQHAKMHLREAEQIFQRMTSEVKDPAHIVKKLLPRMASVRDAKQLLLTSLTDVHSLNRLRKLMGSCLNPMIGLYNGYYELDLSKPEDKVCMTKLLEQSEKLQEERMNASVLGKGFTGDISQKGDWSCFRNELKDSQVIQITSAMFNPMPNKGIYRFDFSGADPPPRKTAAMSDDRCLNVLINLEILQKSKRGAAEISLHEMRRKCIDNNPGIGNFSPVIKTKEQAEAIQFFMLRFYSKNSKRHKQLKFAQMTEELKSTIIERPTLGKKKKKKGKKGKGEEEKSEDSSSSDDDSDYYDDDAAINFVPVYRQGGGMSPLSPSRRTRMLSPHNSSSMLNQLAIEEGSENENDESSSSSSDESFSSSSEEPSGDEDEGPMVTMMDIKFQADKDARERQEKLESGSTPKKSNRKTLLAQFDNTFDSNNRKNSALRTTIVAGNKPVKLRPLQLAHGLNPTPEGSEAAEEMGMMAGRKKRKHITKELSFEEKEVLDKQKQEIDNAPKKLKIPPKAKALRLFSSLIDVFQRVWLRCRHLSLILQHFTAGAINRTADFGSYRVEVVVVLFCRVIDVQNFDLVWEHLHPQEIACIYCRLGMLNFFNPLKLEGCYCLDISRYEERTIAKMLAVMSTVEAGENWINETFRWEYFAECIPGWELTKSWLRDENMPHRGYLYLEYYSGGCTKFGIPLLQHGCNPDIGIRKSLLAMVYLTEDMIIDDECNRDASGYKLHKRPLVMGKSGRQVKSASSGSASMKEHIDHWNALLAPAQSTSAKIAAGDVTEKVFSKLKYKTTNIVKHLPAYEDVHFGEGDVIIDKTSEKGKKMMARIYDRMLRRGKDLPEGAGEGQNTSAAANLPGRKKKMDLSVDPASSLVPKATDTAKSSSTTTTSIKPAATKQQPQASATTQRPPSTEKDSHTKTAPPSNTGASPGSPATGAKPRERRAALRLVKNASRKSMSSVPGRKISTKI